MFEHCLYFNTTALARQMERQWADAFSPFGLTAPQAFLLRLILAKPGLRQFELAQEMGISRPTATRALDALVKSGFVQRSATAHDHREQAVHPTVHALEIRQPLDEASGRVTARLKEQLGETRFAQAVSEIRGVRTALG